LGTSGGLWQVRPRGWSCEGSLKKWNEE